MRTVLAVLSPGQGSQTPGMLRPWLDDPALDTLVGEMSEAARLDLRTLGTTADAATITDTAVAQPLIVAASLVSFAALGVTPDVAAGHSVGELAALAVAGVVTPADAVALAGVRGRAMAEAASAVETGMSAVVGGSRDEVLGAISRAGAVVANVNSGGQVVAAGTPAQLAELAAAPPSRARVIPLAVAGAFHTSYMARAVDAVREAAAALEPHDPTGHAPLQPGRCGGGDRARRARPDRQPDHLTGPLGPLLRADRRPRRGRPRRALPRWGADGPREA
jgi:(acyl-carrier-protein) S-malonyltransferase